METIRCENLTKRYESIIALEDLNLTIGGNTVFGFLGPNGAGKTTTVRLLTGLSIPTAGRAWVAGEEVGPNSTSLHRKIGYLPEEPAFYNWMTGREFLSYVGQLFNLPSKENRLRCDELLELTGLTGAADRKIGGYSRGMRQRLGIAQALMNRPAVLFLDEPCSALDPIGRREILALIRHLSGDSTIFMSTHILSDVERVCDVVGIINHGRLVTVSRIEELRSRYAPPLFELTFEQEPSTLAERLQSLPWVAKVETSVENESPVLRVRATDVNRAKQELPKVAASSGLTLLRYELTLPSIEDVFIELVSEGGEE